MIPTLAPGQIWYVRTWRHELEPTLLLEQKASDRSWECVSLVTGEAFVASEMRWDPGSVLNRMRDPGAPMLVGERIA